MRKFYKYSKERPGHLLVTVHSIAVIVMYTVTEYSCTSHLATLCVVRTVRLVLVDAFDDRYCDADLSSLVCWVMSE